MNAYRILFAALVLAGSGPSFGQSVSPDRMIFFDWGKSELSGDGKATLDRIATEFVTSGKAQLTLSSHSDRSGSSVVNLAMSRKRAEVAAAYLESKGIAPAAIRIVAVGEADQLIQTDDGVREIQNRRIDIQF